MPNYQTVDIQCEICGARASRRVGSRFCSKRCVKKAEYARDKTKINSRNMAYYNKNCRKSYAQIACGVCEKMFTPKRSCSKCCSKECMAKYWHLKNRDKANERIRAWRIGNVDKRREYHKAYRQTEKGKIMHRQSAKHRKAVLRGAKGKHTWRQFLALVYKCQFFCVACGTQFPLAQLTEDHIVPISKGGSNDISNIQPMCHPCNSGKKDRHVNYINDFLTRVSGREIRPSSHETGRAFDTLMGVPMKGE